MKILEGIYGAGADDSGGDDYPPPIGKNGVLLFVVIRLLPLATHYSAARVCNFFRHSIVPAW